MKAPKVVPVLAAALLALLALLVSCEARHTAASDALVPEDDTDTVFSLEEQMPAVLVLPAVQPEQPLKQYVEDDAVPAVPHTVAKRSTVVFRPLFATRERDAERQVAHERRREYWANEERRRLGTASRPAPVYRYPGAGYAPGHAAVYAPAGYPGLGR